MKFSIRDLLWLTLVVALTVGWYVDHRQMLAQNAALEAEAAVLKVEARKNEKAGYIRGVMDEKLRRAGL
jgi:hypothetical protein